MLLPNVGLLYRSILGMLPPLPGLRGLPADEEDEQVQEQALPVLRAGDGGRQTGGEQDHGELAEPAEQLGAEGGDLKDQRDGAQEDQQRRERSLQALPGGRRGWVERITTSSNKLINCF